MTKYATIAYDEIKRETEYAFLFVVGEKEVWIPKLQTINHDEDNQEIDIKEWLAIEEGLQWLAIEEGCYEHEGLEEVE